jgi:hypothetical protein
MPMILELYSVRSEISVSNFILILYKVCTNTVDPNGFEVAGFSAYIIFMSFTPAEDELAGGAGVRELHASYVHCHFAQWKWRTTAGRPGLVWSGLVTYVP